MNVFVAKMKILQENTKMMHRYSLSSNNDVIRYDVIRKKLIFCITDQKFILLTGFLYCLYALYMFICNYNITRPFEDINFIFSW